MNNNKKGVITCDLEGRIETYNQGAEEIFGYIAEEVIGKNESLSSPRVKLSWNSFQIGSKLPGNKVNTEQRLFFWIATVILSRLKFELLPPSRMGNKSDIAELRKSLTM
jgi:PAS domain-containing protein